MLTLESFSSESPDSSAVVPYPVRKRVVWSDLVNCRILTILVVLLLVCPARAQAQEGDEFSDGPGLQIVKWGRSAAPELPNGTLPDRITIKVKNTGTKVIASFTYDFVVFDQNRPDVISSAQTLSVKKTIKPGDSREFESHIEPVDRSNTNEMVRVIKITYGDGTTWDRFQKQP